MVSKVLGKYRNTPMDIFHQYIKYIKLFLSMKDDKAIKLECFCRNQNYITNFVFINKFQ